jgi:hypothetical protein
MKRNLTFVNTTTLTRTDVHVGPDHLLILAGILAVIVRLYSLMSGESWPYVWVVAGVLVAHLGASRHVLTLPVLGSLLLGLMSFGMSMLISGLILNKLVAQSYRTAGWKIRDTEGGLGEYSSRFLAVHELGFSESDMAQHH